MNVNPDEIREVLRQVVEACPGLGAPEKVLPLATAVMQQTNEVVKTVEGRIAEAGKIPGDAVTAIMVTGAVHAVFVDLPESDERRMLLAAGTAIGKLVAKKYGEKIQETLTKNNGGN